MLSVGDKILCVNPHVKGQTTPLLQAARVYVVLRVQPGTMQNNDSFWAECEVWVQVHKDGALFNSNRFVKVQ